MNNEKIKLLNISNDGILSFQERLRLTIGDESVRSFAKKCNISHTVVRKYLMGESDPTLKVLLNIAQVGSVDPAWLVTGAVTQTKPITERYNDDKYITISDLNIQVAAGDGLVPSNQIEPIGEFVLSHEWLKANRLLNKRLAIFHVRGDSMEPTINDDDIALVSFAEDSWTSELSGIFILRVEDALFIKRVHVDMIEKGIHIISDNPVYQRSFIKIDESIDDRIKVVAKVERILTKAIARNER